MISACASTSSAVARQNAEAAMHETREAPGTGILHGTLMNAARSQNHDDSPYDDMMIMMMTTRMMT